MKKYLLASLVLPMMLAPVHIQALDDVPAPMVSDTSKTEQEGTQAQKVLGSFSDENVDLKVLSMAFDEKDPWNVLIETTIKNKTGDTMKLELANLKISGTQVYSTAMVSVAPGAEETQTFSAVILPGATDTSLSSAAFNLSVDAGSKTYKTDVINLKKEMSTSKPTHPSEAPAQDTEMGIVRDDTGKVVCMNDYFGLQFVRMNIDYKDEKEKEENKDATTGYLSFIGMVQGEWNTTVTVKSLKINGKTVTMIQDSADLSATTPGKPYFSFEIPEGVDMKGKMDVSLILDYKADPNVDPKTEEKQEVRTGTTSEIKIHVDNTRITPEDQDKMEEIQNPFKDLSVFKNADVEMKYNNSWFIQLDDGRYLMMLDLKSINNSDEDVTLRVKNLKVNGTSINGSDVSYKAELGSDSENESFLLAYVPANAVKDENEVEFTLTDASGNPISDETISMTVTQESALDTVKDKIALQYMAALQNVENAIDYVNNAQDALDKLEGEDSTTPETPGENTDDEDTDNAPEGNEGDKDEDSVVVTDPEDGSSQNAGAGDEANGTESNPSTYSAAASLSNVHNKLANVWNKVLMEQDLGVHGSALQQARVTLVKAQENLEEAMARKDALYEAFIRTHDEEAPKLDVPVDESITDAVGGISDKVDGTHENIDITNAPNKMESELTEPKIDAPDTAPIIDSQAPVVSENITAPVEENITDTTSDLQMPTESLSDTSTSSRTTPVYTSAETNSSAWISLLAISAGVLGWFGYNRFKKHPSSK